MCVYLRLNTLKSLWSTLQLEETLFCIKHKLAAIPFMTHIAIVCVCAFVWVCAGGMLLLFWNPIIKNPHLAYLRQEPHNICLHKCSNKNNHRSFSKSCCSGGSSGIQSGAYLYGVIQNIKTPYIIINNTIRWYMLAWWSPPLLPLCSGGLFGAVLIPGVLLAQRIGHT